jgi:hypothetical protein
MKIRAVGADVFHADVRTDRHDEADSRFSRFFFFSAPVIVAKQHENRWVKSNPTAMHLQSIIIAINSEYTWSYRVLGK